MPINHLLWLGKEEAPPAESTFTAGALSLSFQPGDLRMICWRGREILRRVYVAVRDRNWGTVPPVYANLAVEESEEQFNVTFDARHTQGEIDFAWHGAIRGQEGGLLTFAMEGEAQTTFLKNRIGFCVLFPPSCAGMPCQVVHGTGAEAVGFSNAAVFPDAVVFPAAVFFPAAICGEQPVPSFSDIQAITYSAAPGCTVSTQFEGEVFEMEDQRNWTDASFKVYCTPLSAPFPVQMQAGEKIFQKIAVTVHEEAATRHITCPAARDAEIEIRAAASPLPALGLGMASHGQALAPEEIARLRALNLNHLRADLRLPEPGFPEQLALAAHPARELGVKLEAALFLSGNHPAELAGLRQALEASHPPVASWLIYPEREYLGGGAPLQALVESARRSLGDYDPQTPFCAGTNADLIFLQRNPLPASQIERVCLAINPQVHAGDTASLVETLPMQGEVVANARRLASGRPVTISPVTLKPRFNPYATAPRHFAPDDLPPEVDQRQTSLFCAGWTLASIAAIAQAGAASITYYETTGWRGVMETQAGSPLPERFPSLPGAVFPVYHILRDLAEFAGGQVLALALSRPLQTGGLALRQGKRGTLLVANFTPKSQRVRLQGTVLWTRMRLLDETNLRQAMTQPEAYRAQSMRLIRADPGRLALNLPPFAVARMDFMAEE